MKKEKLVGGKADNLTPKDIAKKFDVPVDKIKQQIKKGTDVESEHTNNKEKAKEIATDHESEIPNYYDELETMEKNIKENKTLIKKLLHESLEPEPQLRFDRRVYLTYVDQGDNFKHVKTKKEFYDRLYPLVDDVKVVNFDLSRIYRLADEKEIWLSKRKDVLGEIWKDGDIESYWVNKEFMG